MKRVAAFAGIIVVLVTGFVILGSSRSAEGPSQGGVTSAPTKEKAGGGGAPKGPQAIPVLAADVSSRTMEQTLQVSGSLRTDEDVQIGSRIAGKVIRVTAKEGDHITSGQVLVQLDERELMAQISRAQAVLQSNRAKLSLARNQATWKDATAKADYERLQAELLRAKANLSAAKSRLQQAKTNVSIITTTTEKAIETGQSGVRVATERLSIVKDVTRRQELRQAELAIDQAKAQLGQAKVNMDNSRQVYERRQKLFKQDAIAKEEVDESERQFKAMQAEVSVAESTVRVAEQKLELAKEGSRQEEIRIAEGQLKAAERALEVAISDRGKQQVAADEVNAAQAAYEQTQAAVESAEAAVRSAKAGLVQSKISLDDINAARAAIAQAEADIQFYQTQRADLTIRAPVSGIVSARQVNVGEMVTNTTPLMTLVALNDVYLEATVPELEVSQVKPGAAAEITIDALGGKKFKGTVREIIPVADRTSRSYRVRTAVLAGKNQLPVGGFARAEIHVGTRSGTLVVSKDAIHSEAGDKFVWLIGKPEKKAAAEHGEGGEHGETAGAAPKADSLVAVRQIVTVGLVDDRFAEILTGLKPGQQVIAAGSPAIIEGTPVKVAE